MRSVLWVPASRSLLARYMSSELSKQLRLSLRVASKRTEAMSDRREEGIALIAVLWTLMLLSIIAAALSLETHSSTRIARNMAENAVARAAADAGIQRALLDLEASTGAPTAAGRFRTDGTVYGWQFANCMVHISVKDEAFKIDLNKAPEALLAALFASVGVDPGKAQSLADAIADFRDADNLTHPQGAEEAEYRDAGLAWGPKNAPFQTVEELQQVFGMTAEIYKRVASDLSVYSVTATVPTAVDERFARILRQAGFNSASLATAPSIVFSIRAEAKSANGGVFVRQAIVQRGSWILSWQQGGPKT
jgi:general secretion pathway protein K